MLYDLQFHCKISTPAIHHCKISTLKSNFLDLVTGGNVFDRLRDKKPTNATAKLILAEIVSIVEKLHSHDIIHGDLNFKNILIDNDGHFVFTDFGYASKRIDNNSSRRDWSRLALICYNVFPDNDKTHKILKHAMKNMTDEELPGIYAN